MESVTKRTPGVGRGAYRGGMTQTTGTTSPPPPRSAGIRKGPEAQFIGDGLRAFRDDLVRGAWAYRPLPVLNVPDSDTMRLPGMRRLASHAPHVLVFGAIGFALLVCLGTGQYMSLPELMVLGLFAVAPAVLAATRPVAAWWLTMPVGAFASVLTGYGDSLPFGPVSFLVTLIVSTIAAAWQGPRAALWMWLITAAFSLFVSGTMGVGSGSTIPLLFFLGLVLSAVSIWHFRRTTRETVREAHREVSAERSATAAERTRAVRLEERTTIARELHDVVAHHMSVVAIQAEAAPYRVENPPQELADAFAAIRESAVAALTELRRVLGVVRADDYEAPDAPQPVLADLDRLLDGVREAGVPVEKLVTGRRRELPQGVELSAYRMVQEALSNVLRHAPGASARVELAYVPVGLGLRVVNDAPERPADPSPGAGQGLTGMRERAAVLGGELHAGPDESGGFEVSAFLPAPLPAPEETAPAEPVSTEPAPAEPTSAEPTPAEPTPAAPAPDGAPTTPLTLVKKEDR
ncbi:two-component sensor histidine kinase [Streptomyces albidoflavus]|nr:two-component sensor histidine kinase [Streptomyces albidoflavus]